VVKPTSDFFKILGEYVYGYRDPDTKLWTYIGKGVGKRCLSHIKHKGYSIDNCFIIGRNMEKFGGKEHSFSLESFLINKYRLEDNKVAGHYKECFVMESLSFLFDEYQDSKRNMFKEVNDIRVKLEKKFGNTVGYQVARPSSFVIESSGNSGIYFGIKGATKESGHSVYIKVKDDSQFDLVSKSLHEKLGSKYDLDDSSNKNIIAWDVDDLIEAIELWGSTVR
jgi:hypothetical protein